jgi:hypothetical protein
MNDILPHALHYLLLAHIWLLYTLDQAEPEPGFQAEQAQSEGLTNLVGSRQAPVHLTKAPCLLF